MKVFGLVVLLVACTSPQSLSIPDAGVEAAIVETPSPQDAATFDGPTVVLNLDAPLLADLSGLPLDTSEVVDAMPNSKDAATSCDQSCPILNGTIETAACFNGQCHYYCFAPLANCSAEDTTKHAACYESSVCLVAGDPSFFTDVLRGSFCSVLVKDPPMPIANGTWGLADHYGDCKAFFLANTAKVCTAGKAYTRHWHYNAVGGYSSENDASVVTCP